MTRNGNIRLRSSLAFGIAARLGTNSGLGQLAGLTVDMLKSRTRTAGITVRLK